MQLIRARDIDGKVVYINQDKIKYIRKENLSGQIEWVVFFEDKTCVTLDDHDGVDFLSKIPGGL